ncbi:MAG: hypothetical protein P9L99_19200 [Candidatus Lernaella stagnicola]|nr:hypothetical protein [Candidatus Lernaella stagnicola]
MDDVKQMISGLRAQMTRALESHAQDKSLSEIGAAVREQVVRVLKRDDLRISTEVLLVSLRNAFTRYETFEPSYQRQAVEDAIQIIEELETLVVADKVLNPDRIELPDPPPSMKHIVPEVNRIENERRRQRERLKREESGSLNSRRGDRGAKGEAESGRETLSFSDGRPASSKRRGKRGRRPDVKPAEGAKPVEKTDGKSDGAKRRSRRPRRRK